MYLYRRGSLGLQARGGRNKERGNRRNRSDSAESCKRLSPKIANSPPTRRPLPRRKAQRLSSAARAPAAAPAAGSRPPPPGPRRPPARDPAGARGRAAGPRRPRPPARSSSPDFTLSGISARSFSFSFGMITVFRPPRRAASSFSFRPPIGSTRPRSVTSPVMATLRLDRDAGQHRDDRGRHGDAGRRAVLGRRALRHVDVDVELLEDLGLDAQHQGAASGRRIGPPGPTPASRRRACR